MGEVLVRPDPVRPVLVVGAVAVVVLSLGLDPVGAGPLLHGVGLDQDAGIGGVGEPAAGRVGDPHAGDHAVAIQVVRRVLARQAVAVVIDLLVVAAAADAELGEDPVVGVGIERRRHVEGGGREELRRRAGGGSGRGVEQGAQQVERRLGAGVVEAGDVAADEDRRPLVRIRAARRGDARHPERAPAGRLADRDQLHLARVGRAPLLELALDGGERMVVLIAHGRAGGAGHGQQAEGGGRQGGPQAGKRDSHGHLLREIAANREKPPAIRRALHIRDARRKSCASAQPVLASALHASHSAGRPLGGENAE